MEGVKTTAAIKSKVAHSVPETSLVTYRDAKSHRFQEVNKEKGYQ